MQRPVLRTPAAAAYIEMSIPWLEKARVSGVGGPPFISLGGRSVGYLRRDLDEWLESRRVSSTSAVSNLPK
jgi:predicted DNA-binding transcriptional regulator AlpA